MSQDTFTVDMAQALRKEQELLATPKASKFLATRWAAEAVTALKKKAASMQKAGKGRKTGQLARNVAMSVIGGAELIKITVGTGLAGTLTVPYATIQDEGGTTHPTVTPRMRAWAWYMFMKTAGGRKRDRGGADLYKALALTKKTTLTVKIPASLWFTGTMNVKEQELESIMRPENVLAQARNSISGGGTA